ncbi:CDP-alcohol phosphatidyltransferase [Enterobacter cloacae subsp. cloacae GS1]|nr:CDP-alcohol phosphatidyltransferase [Enterobacter cloacae subsp. cloacae GS1]
MLDKHLPPRLKPGLNQLAAALDKPFITPDGLTLAGFAIGVLALPFLALGLVSGGADRHCAEPAAGWSGRRAGASPWPDGRGRIS